MTDHKARGAAESISKVCELTKAQSTFEIHVRSRQPVCVRQPRGVWIWLQTLLLSPAARSTPIAPSCACARNTESTYICTLNSPHFLKDGKSWATQEYKKHGWAHPHTHQVGLVLPVGVSDGAGEELVPPLLDLLRHGLPHYGRQPLVRLSAANQKIHHLHQVAHEALPPPSCLRA